MVLKELIALFNDTSPLSELMKRFDEMMMIAKQMFELSSSFLTGGTDADGVERQLIQMDSKLNTLQQVIRRDILTHLSVQGMGDMIPCLLLMSLSKDVERIGDYCKNIDEVTRHAPQLLNDPLLPDLLNMRAKIMIWFAQTKRAFDRSDRDLAKSTREEAYLLEKECDRVVWSLAANNEGRNAVALALLLRFFKRVTAHMGNVCTSVVMPFDKLDYFEKPGHPGILLEDE